MFNAGRHARKFPAVLLCLATLTAAPASHASWLDSLWPFGGSSSSEEKRTQEWAANPTQELRWGEWELLRIAPGAGATNQHPVQLTPEQVAMALASIQIRPYREVYPLFSEEEIKRFATPIATALARAQPGEDIEFLSMGQHGIIGLIAPSVGNSGRIFFADGRLNVILSMTHKDFEADYQRGSRRKPVFNFGARDTVAPDVHIIGVDRGDGKVLRDDWIAVAIGNPANAPRTLNTTPGGYAAPAPSAVAAPPVDAGEALVRRNEARFKALQRLKEQGLLTEEEFKQKKAEILKDL